MMDGIAALLARLCIAGPLLYLGLLMVVDPSDFTILLGNLAIGLRNFQHRVLGLSWSERPAVGTGSPAVHFALRSGGIVLSALALLFLLGVR